MNRKKWFAKVTVWLMMAVLAICAGCSAQKNTENKPETRLETTLGAGTALTPEAGAETKPESGAEPTLKLDADSASGIGSEPTSKPGSEPTSTPKPTLTPTVTALDPEGTYTSCEDVALYLELYGKLPGNFITKKEAQALGWNGGSLEPYAPGKCIGGDKFGNYEKILPVAAGRVYYECDIDTLGAKSRGAKRIVYSNDGLIYYTEDHYESFQLLYD